MGLDLMGWDTPPRKACPPGKSPCAPPAPATVSENGNEDVTAAVHLAQAAETVIQAVLAKVSGAPYAADAKSLVEIGVTAGFACYPDDATNIAELHVLADRALYAAKRAGKGIGTRYAPTLAA